MTISFIITYSKFLADYPKKYGLNVCLSWCEFIINWAKKEYSSKNISINVMKKVFKISENLKTLILREFEKEEIEGYYYEYCRKIKLKIDEIGK